jgi:two-component system NtrC family response regulator
MNDQIEKVRVLAVSPNEADIRTLSRILGHSAWTLDAVPSLAEARQFLANNFTRVVLCEQKLADGEWKDLLDEVAGFEQPPQLIILSRTGDERLWAEVLNRGAWDVLVKPYHPQEVYRTVHGAWRHWSDSNRMRKHAVRAAGEVYAAAS